MTRICLYLNMHFLFLATIVDMEMILSVIHLHIQQLQRELIFDLRNASTRLVNLKMQYSLPFKLWLQTPHKGNHLTFKTLNAILCL